MLFWVLVLGPAAWFGLGAPLTGGLILLGGLAMASAPLAQAWVHPSLGGPVLVTSLGATITAVAWVNGGSASHLQLAFGVLPVLATATSSLRAGLVWTGLAAVLGVGLHLLGARAPEPELDAAHLDRFQLLIALALPVVLMSFTGLNALAIREARDRAVEANRAKSAFLANVSHELRTPLNAILGYGEMVRDDLEQQDLAPDVERILSSARHLLALVDNVLDLTGLEAGEIQIRPAPTDLDALLNRMIESLAPFAEQRSSTLALHIDGELGEGITDGAYLTKAVSNLIHNAIHFTEAGTIDVRAARSGERLTLVIEDTGIGMTEEVLARVGEAFVQADTSSTRTRDGSGLGLTVSQRIVRALGGDLSLSSTAGEGTRVEVQLPLVDAAGGST